MECEKMKVSDMNKFKGHCVDIKYVDGGETIELNGIVEEMNINNLTIDYVNNGQNGLRRIGFSQIVDIKLYTDLD